MLKKPTRKDYRVTVVCEDLQQGTFLRKLLYLKHFKRVRVEPCPKGKQSGEQWVRERFPRDVKVFRNCGHSNIVLIAVIDADKYSIEERRSHLVQGWKRQEEERILLVIPKRNIETWIHFLMGESVNEQDAYSKLKRERDCKPALESWLKKHQLPKDPPPSFLAFQKELERLKV